MRGTLKDGLMKGVKSGGETVLGVIGMGVNEGGTTDW